MIDASGVLTVPKMPEIEGVDAFAGATLHTARWDHGQDLAGKRVAVIGTGASAVQVIPAIAPEVEHLTVFQRTPIWCLPKLDGPLPASVSWFLTESPAARRGPAREPDVVEMFVPAGRSLSRRLPIANWFEGSARKYLREQVDDPELREKLTPRYALGCKRPSFHNEYLATFNRANVTLETTRSSGSPRRDRRPRAARTHVDVLGAATGFKVFEPGNVPKYPVTGRGGVDLEQWWDENRIQAYEGVSVPGFPNYFSMFGPYGYNGSSYFNLVETQRGTSSGATPRARSRATMIEVRREANDRYFAEMLRRRGRQIFWQASCALANSYYFDPTATCRCGRRRRSRRCGAPALPARRLPARAPRRRRQPRRGGRGRLASRA